MGDLTTQASLLSRVRDLSDQAAWREFDAKYRELILRYCRRPGAAAVRRRGRAPDGHAEPGQGSCARSSTSPRRDASATNMGQTVANAIHRYYRRPRPEQRGLSTTVASELVDEGQADLDREWEIEWMDHHYRLALQTVRESSDPKSIEVFEHMLSGESPDQVARRFGMTRDAVRQGQTAHAGQAQAARRATDP